MSDVPEWLPAYVRELADGLGLRDWTFAVYFEKLPDETVAEVRFAGYRKHAGIAVDPKRWKKANRDWRREVVVHELIHCHVNTVFHVLSEDIVDGKLMNQIHYNMAYSAMQRQVEYATDGIAAAISRFFPLPPETTPDA